MAIIMDGNGRWATERGEERPSGHHAGAKSVRTIVEEARRVGIAQLTLFAFSAQNWLRPRPEVDALMVLLEDYLIAEAEALLDKKIQLTSIGDKERLPKHTREVLDRAIKKTAQEKAKMQLTLALSYGGQEEILCAARSVAEKVRSGTVSEEEIDKSLFESFLPSALLSPVDLLIRTGGEKRISNFMLWSTAYSEIFFSECLWPDFGAQDLHDALDFFAGRERRFGRVHAVGGI